MRNTSVNFLLLIAMLLVPASLYAQSSAEKQRQFDFWIGEWDVNLRVQQKDKTWKDQHKSVARIYSILGGKAILELWSEKQDGINGYSLRYYNSKTDKWDLWLNWPGKNRSGTTGLSGSFRHGRGEFYSEQKIDEKTTQISRYTFSDATPTSLRWDDGYSRDGGKTWSSNWIMEFSRRAAKATAIDKDKNLLTYFDGSRCDLPEFDLLKTAVAKAKDDSDRRLYNFLDGCAIMGFVKEGQSFFTLTYNTYASVYELGFLNSEPDTRLVLYYGSLVGNELKLKSRKAGANERPAATIRFETGIAGIVVDYEGKERRIGFLVSK